MTDTPKRAVIDIVAEHLRANGFGGLVEQDGECGCELDDLQPCGSDFASCRAAYRHEDPTRLGAWLITQKNEAPTQEQFDDAANENGY